MNVPTQIQNYEAVVDFFGSWPSFHDANVVAYDADVDSIKLTLHTWRITNQVDANGYLVLRHHALVSFRFSGLHDVQMDAFNSRNILSSLEISPCSDRGSCRVELDSVMDLSGSFSAKSGEIVSVIPCDSDGVVA
ncbi:hypothetical protein C7S18_00165 [Ahniella affigens]|uniref:Uncharacterized protein n=1 Tax=Ahniella affigens TaxID=2021234 RepID=A0A2P1PLH5_9GAMM|nr:hypothetical protein C7S18_00165 [Ahniella affigens]